MPDWLRGNRTYTVAVATALTAGLAAIGVPVPVWVWPLLGSLGLGFLRIGVSNALKQANVDKITRREILK